MIRRVGIPVFLKGRIVMFTDGKCTSTSVRQDVDDENYNPMESMDIVRNMTHRNNRSLLPFVFEYLFSGHLGKLG